MKKKGPMSAAVLGAVLGVYVAFMLGRFSHLITAPEIFMTPKEKWAVARATQYALEVGIAPERLKNPKVIDAGRVYFGGVAGAGGVEITMMKDNGEFLDSRH